MRRRNRAFRTSSTIDTLIDTYRRVEADDEEADEVGEEGEEEDVTLHRLDATQMVEDFDQDHSFREAE